MAYSHRGASQSLPQHQYPTQAQYNSLSQYPHTHTSQPNRRPQPNPSYQPPHDDWQYHQNTATQANHTTNVQPHVIADRQPRHNPEGQGQHHCTTDVQPRYNPAGQGQAYFSADGRYNPEGQCQPHVTADGQPRFNHEGQGQPYLINPTSQLQNPNDVRPSQYHTATQPTKTYNYDTPSQSHVNTNQGYKSTEYNYNPASQNNFQGQGQPHFPADEQPRFNPEGQGQPYYPTSQLQYPNEVRPSQHHTATQPTKTYNYDTPSQSHVNPNQAYQRTQHNKNPASQNNFQRHCDTTTTLAHTPLPQPPATKFQPAVECEMDRNIWRLLEKTRGHELQRMQRNNGVNFVMESSDDVNCEQCVVKIVATTAKTQPELLKIKELLVKQYSHLESKTKMKSIQGLACDDVGVELAFREVAVMYESVVLHRSDDEVLFVGNDKAVQSAMKDFTSLIPDKHLQSKSMVKPQSGQQEWKQPPHQAPMSSSNAPPAEWNPRPDVVRSRQSPQRYPAPDPSRSSSPKKKEKKKKGLFALFCGSKRNAEYDGDAPYAPTKARHGNR